jgi:hypothetical protein
MLKEYGLVEVDSYINILWKELQTSKVYIK